MNNRPSTLVTREWLLTLACDLGAREPFGLSNAELVSLVANLAANAAATVPVSE